LEKIDILCPYRKVGRLKIKTTMYIIIAILVAAVIGTLNTIYIGNNEMNLIIAIVVTVSGLLLAVWMGMESRKKNRRIKG
jgi:uncharacterized membrane protein YfcA